MKIIPITGAVQHYAWGGTDFIPKLLKKENPQQQPFAELWMGAHDRGPAQLEQSGITLNTFIANAPIKVLGEATAKRFNNRLPFLFKVLDVANMLSIQSHPTKAQAIIGFAAENAAGIPLAAPHRSFRDDNHKPEIMVALTEFWLLHGFRPAYEIEVILDKVPEFATLRPYFAQQNIYTLYEAIMYFPQETVNTLLAPLHARLATLEPPKDTPDYWAKKAFQDYTRDGNYDRGIFSIYLFNLVRLQEGEGIFQAAGVAHAYLEGVNMELMANSDNVFRGGLTPKHIDVPKLLQHLVTDSVVPKILTGKLTKEGEYVYQSTAPDFELSRIEISKEQTYMATAHTPTIFIVMEGVAHVQHEGSVFERTRGQSFFVSANTIYQISTLQTACMYKASVPMHNSSSKS
ncbi:MAG: mannose-6-phosphate isomerase, class I [Bacteroidota bacterium]